MAVDDVLLYAFMLQNVWKEIKEKSQRTKITRIVGES
jgi:hypothetical protein